MIPLKKTLRYFLYVLLALVLSALVALVLIVKLALAPAPGEWSTRIEKGPIRFELGVPTVIRLATAPWFAPRLDGHGIETSHGLVRFAWKGGALEARCAPCSAEVPALGKQPIRVTQLLVTVRRDGNALAGTLEATPSSGTPLRGQWTGRLSQKDLQLQADLAEAPIAQWYAVFAPELPELARAQIGGTLSLKLQLALPEQRFSVLPRIGQFSVSGLGTEALLGARTACGPPSRLGQDSWLARAVIAAEDQRFFQHGGYDLTELLSALEGNQQSGRTERGGSTLTQQLAKLLVTGSERTAERKLRELLYAVEMEQTLGKARVLQLYLDNAPWGGNLCGAESAARHYFKRSASRLEPAQAVWLAALLHNPAKENRLWATEGSPDAARLKWIAESVRGIPRRQRELLLQSVEKARYAAP